MKKKTMLIIGILGIILILGAAVALAQNAGSEKTKDSENHECTPEMMQDMSKNCPEQMMQSSECENMMGDEIGHSGMMSGSTTSNNAEAGDGEHCGDMGSDMGSMMGSGGNGKNGMM
ncbi:MAG: hypothetical protein Q7J35_17530 [Candidatus Methanoperedens sp.]|nr:hypothetical protein [Candidatus Methanoperedens sp.]